MNERECRQITYARSSGACEKCGLQRATEWHHRKARSQGGLWLPSNGLHLDHQCHMEITDTRAVFYDNGWLVKSWQNPAEVPVLHHQWGLVLLTDDGDIHLHRPEQEAS